MGQLRYTHAVTGTIGTVTHSFTSSYTSTIGFALDKTVDVTNAWLDLTALIGNGLVVLINTGDSDALIRLTNAANYIRLNLPAGKMWALQRDQRFAAATDATGAVAVYSTGGTTIQVGIFY